MRGPSEVTKRVFLIFGASIMIMMAPRWIRPAIARQAQKKSSRVGATNFRLELQHLGEKIAKAVLDKDIPTLLTYDRGDLRSADAASLNNTKTDLYCYLFDSECITWGDGAWRSVYEKLSGAKSLQIKVNLVRSSADQQLYGSLLFYDASTIAVKDLRSFEFVCKEAPARVASWRFRLENGHWKAVTPLFDSETLGACPGPPHQDEDQDKGPQP